MSRIRSIKPESCTSLTLAKVSERAALMFAYLPCFCDDEGRMAYSPALIKSQLFGLRDNVSQHDCMMALEELEAVNLVVTWAIDGRSYLKIVNFSEHQHPKKPQPSRIPLPPAETEQVDNDGATGGEPVGNRLPLIEDSIGEDRRVEERYIVGQARPIIEYLNSKTGKSFKPTSRKTQALIHARFSEGYTESDFRTVIDNKCSDWLHDRKMSAFLRPETLFGTKFEGYLNENRKEARYGEYR